MWTIEVHIIIVVDDLFTEQTFPFPTRKLDEKAQRVHVARLRCGLMLALTQAHNHLTQVAINVICTRAD